jgi:hypothetical protein
MSERFYTTLHISGPNAATAEKAAIEALKRIKHEEHRACWIDKDVVEQWEFETPEQKQEALEECGYPHFFDHASGELAVQTVGALSRQYPTETFTLHVDGGMAEGQQGAVFITNGKVRDGRSGFISYGEYLQPLCEPCHPHAFKAEDLLPIDRNVDRGRIECPKCHTLYEYINLKNANKYEDNLEWCALYEISAETAEVKA